MQPDERLAAVEQAIERLEGKLAAMRQRVEARIKPSPAEVRALHGLAQGLTAETGQMLGLREGVDPPENAAPEVLDAYDRALGLCVALTEFSLSLSRRFGPAYLTLPGSAR